MTYVDRQWFRQPEIEQGVSCSAGISLDRNTTPDCSGREQPSLWLFPAGAHHLASSAKFYGESLLQKSSELAPPPKRRSAPENESTASRQELPVALLSL